MPRCRTSFSPAFKPALLPVAFGVARRNLRVYAGYCLFILGVTALILASSGAILEPPVFSCDCAASVPILRRRSGQIQNECFRTDCFHRIFEYCLLGLSR